MLTLNDSGSWAFNGAKSFCLDCAFAIDGLTKSIDDAANQCLTNRNRHNTTGSLNDIALFDALVTSHYDNGDCIFLQVLSHTVGTIRKFHELASHALVKAGSFGDTVTYENDNTGLTDFDFALVVFYLVADNFCYFFGFEFHRVPAFSSEYGFTQQFPDRLHAVANRIIQALTVIVQAYTA